VNNRKFRYWFSTLADTKPTNNCADCTLARKGCQLARLVLSSLCEMPPGNVIAVSDGDAGGTDR
jgi:hypothetical protein